MAVNSSLDSLLPSSSACTSSVIRSLRRFSPPKFEKGVEVCGRGQGPCIGSIEFRARQRDRIEKPSAWAFALEDNPLVFFRNAQHLADHGDRKTEGEIGDQVHVALRFDAVYRLIHDLLDAQTHVLDGAVAEGFHHKTAKARVIGRVLTDHPVQHGLIDRLFECLFARGALDSAGKVLPETRVPQNERNVGVAARHGIAERRPVHGVQTAQAVIGWVGQSPAFRNAHKGATHRQG